MGRNRRGTPNRAGRRRPITAPDLTATRAITIHAPADLIWPWIAQLGQGRGGFYTYDWPENLLGLDMHSADRIVSAFASHRFGGQITSYRTFAGLTIPSTGNMGWHYGTDRWPEGEFFQFQITHLRPLNLGPSLSRG